MKKFLFLIALIPSIMFAQTMGNATYPSAAVRGSEQDILNRILYGVYNPTASATATAGRQDTQITAEQAIQATAGATSGAKVITDANGTLQQYLRGLVYLLGNKPTVGIDQTTDGTTNNVYARDAGAAWTAANGVAGARFTSADQTAAVASVTDAPTSTKKLVITDIIISVDTAMRVDFTVESSATVIESVYMSANSTVNLITRSKRKLATADKKLQVKTSAAGNISVNAFYYSE